MASVLKLNSKLGWPEMIRTDRGAGFISARVRAGVADTGTLQDILPAYRGDLKPFAESWESWTTSYFPSQK